MNEIKKIKNEGKLKPEKFFVFLAKKKKIYLLF